MDRVIPFFLIPFMAWGVRRYLIARGGYTTLKKITLGIGISAFALNELA